MSTSSCVDLTAEMQADIPLVFNGDAPAIETLGGSLFSALDHIKVSALPADLPKEIEVDVSGLVDFEMAIHVRDLVVNTETVQVVNDPDDLVVRVNPPRAVEEVVAPEAEAEGPRARKVPPKRARPRASRLPRTRARPVSSAARG